MTGSGEFGRVSVDIILVICLFEKRKMIVKKKELKEMKIRRFCLNNL